MAEYMVKWKNYIYRALYAGIYCGILLAAGHGYLGIPQVGRRELAVVVFLFVLVFVFGILNLRGKLLMLAGAVAVLAVTWLVRGTEDVLMFGREYLQWAMGRAAPAERLFFFQCLQLLWLVLVGILVAYLGEAFPPVHYLVFCGILTGAVICLVYEREIPRAGTAFFFCFLLLNLAELAEKYWTKERNGQGLRAYIVWLWPVWVLFFLMLLITPVSNQPYDWKFARNIYQRVSEKWTVLTQHIGKLGVEEFDIKMSGFEEESPLGGNLAHDRATLLKVSSEMTAKNNLYLAGTWMDTFDGREWTSDGADTFDCRLDTLETLYAVRLLDEEHVDRYLDGMRLKLEYQYFRSEFFFTPGKATSLEWEQENLLEQDEQTQKKWKKAKNYGDVYSVYFFQMNGNRENRQALVEQQPAFDEKEWNALCRQYKMEPITKEDMSSYRSSIRQIYCEAPSLTPKLQEWVKIATEGCSTKTERLYAIESALQSYRYTTTPGKLPKWIDTPEEFLEYLLLQKQEGYCTYFATAFVLLARAEGFPARFVKGFSVPMADSKEMLITGDMAHAWPEVYFEGVGWILFEPTPGFGGRLYTAWKEKETIKRNPGEIHPPEWSIPEEEPVVEEPPEEEPVGDSRPLFYGIGIFLVLLALIFLTDLWFSRYRYAHSSLQEKFCRQVRRALLIAGKRGVERQEGETLCEFGRRLDEALADTWETPPIFWRAYEEVLYGEIPVTEEMVRIARTERCKLMEGLGRRDYLVEQYLFFREI